MGGWEERGRDEAHGRVLNAPIIPPRTMIQLTDKDVAEFRTLFREETGKEITDEQARAYAENLIRLVAFVTKPGTSASDS